MTTATLQITLDERSFEEVAIQRLREHEPVVGYRLAFSGGKDSVVIKHLADQAGVKYRAHYSMTTIDPPEIYQFIRKYHPDVEWHRPKRSMFKVIEQKKALPTRMMRFCCRELKEMGRRGETVITGIRWVESSKRRARHPYEESTLKKGLFFVNPIIEWSNQDVWDYIRKYRIPYCSLYDDGYNRIGCIMCPLQGEKGMRKDAERFPKIFQQYMKTIQKVIDSGPSPFWEGRTADQVMEWWITGKWPG